MDIIHVNHQDVRWDYFRSKRSGWLDNGYDAAILTYSPTGESFESSTGRSLHANKQICIDQLMEYLGQPIEKIQRELTFGYVVDSKIFRNKFDKSFNAFKKSL